METLPMIHPICAKLPQMSASEFADLRESSAAEHHYPTMSKVIDRPTALPGFE